MKGILMGCLGAFVGYIYARGKEETSERMGYSSHNMNGMEDTDRSINDRLGCLLDLYDFNRNGQLDRVERQMLKHDEKVLLSQERHFIGQNLAETAPTAETTGTEEKPQENQQ
jgi:hypothetical protein